jgi:fatty acid desaturase
MTDLPEHSARAAIELIQRNAIQPITGLSLIFFSSSFIQAGLVAAADDPLYWICRIGAAAFALVGLVAVAHDVWHRIKERSRIQGSAA